MSTTSEVIALVCLVWYFFIILVCAIGTFQLFYHYSTAPTSSVSAYDLATHDVPHVTVIRPCKGIEPYLYECLASTFQQDYPKEKLTLFLCVSSREDPAFSVLQQVLQKYGPQEGGAGYNVRILVEEEDPVLHPQNSVSLQHRELQAREEQWEGAQQHAGPNVLGPNPKIRNMSRAYREAKGDTVWIIDCNVWVNRGACGRMVDKLCGFAGKSADREVTIQRPYKFVHQLPIAVDVDGDDHGDAYGHKLSTSELNAATSHDEPSTVPLASALQTGPEHSRIHEQAERQEAFGCRLEELFLSSSHAKMYTAINVVAVAPCIVDTRIGSGIDYFSWNICEDHLIGDLLWKSKLPDFIPPNFSNTNSVHDPKSSKTQKRLKWRNHGLVTGDLAIQPISRMSVGNYIARRVRWLRVRKFTVPVATLVEPGTESFVCSAMGVWGLLNSVYTRNIFRRVDQIESVSQFSDSTNWIQMLLMWLLSISVWALWDRQVRKLLFSGKTIEKSDVSSSLTLQKESEAKQRRGSSTVNETNFPPFVLHRYTPFSRWLSSWIGRESLALPIWTWAIWGGVSVTWREKRFWVGLDMKVHAYDDNGQRKHEEVQAHETSRSERTERTITPQNNGNGFASSNGEVKVARRKKQKG